MPAVDIHYRYTFIAISLIMQGQTYNSWYVLLVSPSLKFLFVSLSDQPLISDNESLEMPTQPIPAGTL